ncbi:MAG: glycosyltransferase [Bacteroidales bacterium]|jgi:ubiquinone/menaquinone biosynthesis C-methylase UbiE|nr:glycosyltransferase [Bacteroidales bacterium]
MKEYFENAASNWQKYRQRRSYYWNSITDYVGYYIHPDNTVLEIGCGTGELIASVNGSHKVGIDFCESLIEQARKAHPNDVDFYVMEAENITLDEKFDVVVLSNLVGFLDDIEKVLREIRKVCHERTRVIVTSYNRLWEPMIRFAEFIHIKRRTPQQNWISRDDLCNMLYLSGFETYRFNSNMLCPVYIPLISPLFNKVVSHLPLMGALSLNNYFFARPMPEDGDWVKRYSVSVVIPARNESGNIRAAVERIPDMGSHTEIIFVEGNSTDDTWDEIQRISNEYAGKRDIKIMRQDGRGKGDAVRKGYAAATGDILMILDADLTVPPEDLPKFYRAIATGKGEFVNGVRLVYPMEQEAMRTLNNIGNHFFSRLFSWILETPVKDTLCGTKVMFRTDYLRLAEGRKFFGDFDPFGDFDLLFGAYKLNLRIVDLPIRYRERKYGSTNISRFRHGFILLRMSVFAATKIRFR